MPLIDYEPPLTCKRFMNSEAFGRLIAGPVGSGKTTACLFECLRRALEQSAGEDGLRHTRFAIVRQTLKQLKDTVLKDCQQWFGQLGYWRVSEGVFHLDFHDVRSELFFLPLETQEDQGRLLSMQLTGGWLSECIEMNIDVLAPLSGRIGRFPSAQYGNPTWSGLIADTNMPSEGSDWHKFMTEPPPDWDIYVQPSGMSAEAENLPFLIQTDQTKLLSVNDPRRIAQGRSYYERFVNMHGADSDWVKRYVYAQFGDDPSGQAVFRHCFVHSFHVVRDTNLVPGYPVIVGQDFGRDPWSLICQVDHLGRLVVHEEVPGDGIGLEIHINKSLKPRLLQDRYLGYRYCMVGDPAGKAKSTITEESTFDTLKRMGLPAFPAPTNDLDPRLRAVEALLVRQTNGGPSLMINGPKCPTLVRALNGAYRYTKTKMGNTKPTPDKNPYSHVADALQYAALIALGGAIPYIMGRLNPPRNKRQPMPMGGWT